MRAAEVRLLAALAVAFGLARYLHGLLKMVVESEFIDFAHYYTYAVVAAKGLDAFDPAAVEIELPFRRGDRLLLYTDGITEARNRSGRFLGPDALARVLQGTAREPLEAVADAVCATTADFRRGAPEDDVLVVVAELA